MVRQKAASTIIGPHAWESEYGRKKGTKMGKMDKGILTLGCLALAMSGSLFCADENKDQKVIVKNSTEKKITGKVLFKGKLGNICLPKEFTVEPGTPFEYILPKDGLPCCPDGLAIVENGKTIRMHLKENIKLPHYDGLLTRHCKDLQHSVISPEEEGKRLALRGEVLAEFAVEAFDIGRKTVGEYRPNFIFEISDEKGKKRIKAKLLLGKNRMSKGWNLGSSEYVFSDVKEK